MAIDPIITNYRHLLVSRRSILFFSLRLWQVVIGSPVIILNLSLSDVLIWKISKSKQRILFHTPRDMPNSPYHIKPNLTFVFFIQNYFRLQNMLAPIDVKNPPWFACFSENLGTHQVWKIFHKDPHLSSVEWWWYFWRYSCYVSNQ